MSDEEYKIEKIELMISSLSLAEGLITGLTLHEIGPEKLDETGNTVPISVEIPAAAIGAILEKYSDIKAFKDIKKADMEEECSNKLIQAIKYIFRVGLMKFPEHLKDLQRMQNDAGEATKH